MLDTISFATGAALCAMLGALQRRADRGGPISGYLLLWTLGFVWTFGNFLRGAMALAGVEADAFAARAAETFAWSCTLLGPIAIGRLLQAGIGTASRASRGFRVFTLGVALLNLGLMVRAGLASGLRLESTNYPSLSFQVALAVGGLALWLYLRERGGRPRRVMPRWFAPVALLFAAVHTSAILLSMLFPRMPLGLMATAEMIGRHWTIPWSVLIAVSLAQAHYADLVLKRSLGLMASVVIATLAVEFGMTVVPGLPRVGAILLIAALMCGSPWLLRVLGRFVDRVILARPDFALAGQRLEQAFRGARQPAELIDAALQCLRATLHVDARWVEAERRMDVTVSHGARTLMQRELAFVETVQRQLDHRLDALHFETEQRALLLREERLKRLLTEAELKALRTQVDPHFLFNTLNTIVDLIGTDPGQAERMTQRLAECFRYALAKHSRDLATLDEELEFARHYLEIEQVRFGERLRVQLSRGDASGSEAVPSLLLQPLLENAVRHGLAPLREGGFVSVQASRDGERLRLRIEDDGVGWSPGSPAGVGLHNVQERLRTLYAHAAEFVIGARPGGRGTLVSIVIPLHAL